MLGGDGCNVRCFALSVVHRGFPCAAFETLKPGVIGASQAGGGVWAPLTGHSNQLLYNPGAEETEGPCSAHKMVERLFH